MIFNNSTLGEGKIGTRDIIKPVLLVMAHAERAGIATMPTSRIRELVRQSVILSEQDQAPLKNRSDSRFDQIVRNLVSHKTLINLGYVSYQTPRKDLPSPGEMRLTARGKAYLASQCLGLIELPSLEDNANSINVSDDPSVSRLGEEQIVIPALLLLAKLNADRDNNPVSTTDLRQALKSSIVVSPEDVAPLKNRKDTKVDQLVRNLISHGTLEKSGWVERSEKGLKVTQAGLVRLLGEFLDVLPAPDFGDKNDANVQAKRRVKVGA